MYASGRRFARSAPTPRLVPTRASVPTFGTHLSCHPHPSTGKRERPASGVVRGRARFGARRAHSPDGFHPLEFVGCPRLDSGSGAGHAYLAGRCDVTLALARLVKAFVL